MRVLVVGAGAVGGWFGAKLAEGGHPVSFVARREHGAAIRERGLIVETPDGGELVARGPVLEDVALAERGGFDLALVAVKASSLAEVAPGTGAALAPTGVAIPLLNGLDSERELASIIGAEHVVGGVAQLAAALVTPGRVRVRAGGMMTLAPLANDGFERVQSLASELDRSFPCVAEPDLARVLWTKLLWNAPFNGVCALTRKNAGDVLAVPALESLIRDAMREIVLVARSEGVDLGEHAVDAMLAITRGMFSSTEPSMLQDVVAGRATEADALQGAVMVRGERHGLATPIHRTLHALLVGSGHQYFLQGPSSGGLPSGVIGPVPP